MELMMMGGLSTVISIVTFAIFAAGVMKVFQMATTLTEIKDLLASNRHNAPIGAPVPTQVPTIYSQGQTGEEMLRALTAELDRPEVPSTPVEPR